MASASGADFSSEMEVDAFRRLFPLRFHERHLLESILPDGRPLKKPRDTSIVLGAITSANGSALAKIGSTAMLAAIKMEVMTPTMESPDEGCIAVDFHMPPICSPIVRPGRPAEAVPVIAKQLSDTILGPMKHILKILTFLVAVSALWIGLLQASIVPKSYTWLLPLYFIVSLGCYGLLMVGVGLMQFPTCPQEAILLRQDIVEAKYFLKKKGVDVGAD